MTVGIYPGSFDPVHLGHLDVIVRAARVFDRLIVAVARNSEKEGLFTPVERLEMLRSAVGDLRNVEVDAFDGLTVEYARARGAGVLVKGLRAVVDFEYELKQAAMNARLAPEIDTVFFMTSPPYYFVSSTLIREVGRLGGSVAGLVPEGVEERLRAKFRRT
ncbi:MAG: pantetheine-phosphate adenylyltransferase [Armatimonadota bacterium]|nr:pantetheine-phosphate adenylyltransferase [Armatimonadota bacterium]MDR7450295.1 pantetheine-phosphate adenylyltransferase [Armatimonadota bacterium]MDR7467122.1 pantetheine-phosphate adenylyltransferase [Armatimonadota bacterium]MDR7493336.1 pantetheine-phosphate adenylyltransferase [Armatimonadota bacterium]MDR7499344.1 pantetheine-phosphate adenylyltransferase [Armatimonadota bacterium]